MKAGKKVDVDQWELGDALLKEAEDKSTGSRGLRAVVREFAELTGLEYDERYLRLLRQTAETFPPARRYDGEHNTPMIVLRAHTAAGHPDSLDAIVKAAKKDGINVTLENVEHILRSMRKEERDRRVQEKEDAKVALSKAEAEERQAINRRDNAKTESERKHATTEREQARKNREQARERVRNVRLAPARKDLPPPKEEAVGGLLAKTRFSADVSGVRSMLRRMYRDIEPNVQAGDLSIAFVNASIEELLETRAELDHLLALLRKSQGKRGTHLHAVGE
jgi:hypothetical protein